MSLTETFRSKQFAKFIIFNGIAALLNFLSRIFFSQFVSFRIAVLLAFVVGITTAFILSRNFVFDKSSQSTTKQFSYFFIINGLALIQVWVVSVGLAEYLFPILQFDFYREEVAHLIGITLPVFTSYIGHKKFSFK